MRAQVRGEGYGKSLSLPLNVVVNLNCSKKSLKKKKEAVEFRGLSALRAVAKTV